MKNKLGGEVKKEQQRGIWTSRLGGMKKGVVGKEQESSSARRLRIGVMRKRKGMDIRGSRNGRIPGRRCVPH